MLESKNTKTNRGGETMEKPLQRPAKRFVELPGGSLKRISGTRKGGPWAEHTQIMKDMGEKKILGRPDRRSSGYHNATLGTGIEIDVE